MCCTISPNPMPVGWKMCWEASATVPPIWPQAMRFFKLVPGDITVFHDELDLAPGKVKLKTGGGHAGHNGLRSLHAHIGDSYHRVRLGIGHPGHKDRVAPYVLSDFAKADEGWLDDLLRGISDGAPHLAAGQGAKFTNAVGLRMAPPAPKPKPKPAAPEAEPSVAGVAVAGAGAASPEEPRSPLQKLVDKFR